ncbi:hypothetical protein CKA32_003908 [Geitlerinema sp. FC II]|nr:hypothetical protein CKA32_003908 [Geitlerinema sp. FC II]
MLGCARALRLAATVGVNRRVSSYHERLRILWTWVMLRSRSH